MICAYIRTEVGPTVTASFAHDRKEIIFRLLDPSSLKIVGRQRNHDDDPVYDIDTLQVRLSYLSKPDAHNPSTCDP